MNIKTRVLVQTLSASLAFTLLLSIIFFMALARINTIVIGNSGDLGDSAALIGASALEGQLTLSIEQLASDWAVILNEKFIKIENHTRTTADIAGSIYTRKGAYRPHPLPRVNPGEVTPHEPYLYVAPGVEYSAIRAEAELAGNIGDLVRQIMVIGRGIATSTIGGQSGYVIGMDAVAWPLAAFDPRGQAWYRGAAESGSIFWTDTYADLRGRGPVVSCAVPFYESTAAGPVLRGVARSTVMLAEFSKIIDSAKAGRTGYLFLLDRKGLKLYSSGSASIKADKNGGLLGENYLESGKSEIRSLALSMTLGAQGMTKLEIDDGIPVFAAYAPIETLGWSLGVAVPVKEVAAPAFQIENRILNLTGQIQTGINRHIQVFTGFVAFMLLLSLFIIAFFSIRFTSAITGPILALNEGVKEVSAGNLKREVSIRTGDELEQLASSFNVMTRRLEEHIAQIEKDTAEKERIATELDVAASIQTSILPFEFPPFPGRKNEFELYAEVYPAREVGGDFYDFFFIDEKHFAVIAADVSGKGIPAALFMAITKTIIKNRLQGGEKPEAAMKNINNQLCSNNIAGMFVTLWLGILELEDGRITYINAGHTPPLLRQEGGEFEFLVSQPDLVLAAMEGTEYRSYISPLKKGGVLFLYTDGVTEAENPAGEFYGKKRLKAFLEAQGETAPRDLVYRLRSELGVFSGENSQSDDITMLALKFSPAPEKHLPLLEKAPPEESAWNEKDGASISLDASMDKLEDLIAFLNRNLESAACPEKIRGQIELASEELFVNITRYAYQNGETGKVTVDCKIEETGGGTVFSLCFSDLGEPFNPLEHEDPDIDAPLEERESGGLGILLVKKTMDDVNYLYENGMNRIIVKKAW